LPGGFDEIIDGSGLILGRLASIVAKRLLNGERVAVVNAEKIVISGNRRFIVERYKKRLEIKDKAGPWKGPFWMRRPDTMFKRTVRGMLPRKQYRGRRALKRLRVYIGVPRELEPYRSQFVTFPEIHCSRLSKGYITLEELATEIGHWTPPSKRA